MMILASGYVKILREIFLSHSKDHDSLYKINTYINIKRRLQYFIKRMISTSSTGVEMSELTGGNY